MSDLETCGENLEIHFAVIFEFCRNFFANIFDKALIGLFQVSSTYRSRD